MAFIIFFFFLKKFEKVEKTGIISTRFSLRCTPSVILGSYMYMFLENYDKGIPSDKQIISVLFYEDSKFVNS